MNQISKMPIPAGPPAALAWSEQFCGGAWLLRDYASVAAALRDPRFSVRRAGRWINSVAASADSASGSIDLRPLRRYFSRSMLFADGPAHARLRSIVQAEFTPAGVQRQAAAIEQTVQRLINRMLANASVSSTANHGCQTELRFDFMRDFARPLPAMVIAAMLGIDDGRTAHSAHSAASSNDQQTQFVNGTTAIAAFIGSPTATLPQALAAQQALLDMVHFFEEILRQRAVQDHGKSEPKHDLISRLMQAAAAEQLSPVELLAQCCTLLFAGYETTRHLLGNGVLALLQHPAQWQLLRQDPGKLPRALRELLRHDSPVQYTGRRLLEDVTLHGQQLRRGDLVILDIGAANHDPQRFTCPGQLDVERDQGNHLSFGHGPHVCLGAALTYLEAEIALRVLLRRLPTLALAGTPQWQPNAAYRGMDSLPLSCPAAPISPAPVMELQHG